MSCEKQRLVRAIADALGYPLSAAIMHALERGGVDVVR